MNAIAGLDEPGFRARPVAGEWTAAEVLSHLLSTERIVINRAQAALAQKSDIVIPQTDDERQEGARLAQRLPVPQIVHGLLAQRRDTLRLLDRLSAGELARRFQHQRWGERTVVWLFERAAEHEEEHACQIRTLRAVGAPAGP